MINSTSSSDRTVRPDAVSAAPAKILVRANSSDHFSAANSAALQAALAGQPEIRPDVVARGRALAADPAYPSRDILQQIGQKIINSPDPSAAAS